MFTFHELRWSIEIHACDIKHKDYIQILILSNIFKKGEGHLTLIMPMAFKIHVGQFFVLKKGWSRWGGGGGGVALLSRLFFYHSDCLEAGMSALKWSNLWTPKKARRRGTGAVPSHLSIRPEQAVSMLDPQWSWWWIRGNTIPCTSRLKCWRERETGKTEETRRGSDNNLARGFDFTLNV